MRLRTIFPALLLASLPALCTAQRREAPLTSSEERAMLHAGPDWKLVSEHLPDPRMASAAQLETAGDVLRARRFPEDALDYYDYAVARGGNVDELLNKMGVVRLELRQTALARQMFLRVARANKKNSQAWNNLGVAEFSEQNYSAAVLDYKRAVRLNGRSAIYHSNLAMAYFEMKDMSDARTQFARAIELDPTIMQRVSEGGVTAHVLESRNYPELCFEMARMYAHMEQPVSMRLWLAKASEGGFEVADAMRSDRWMKPYLNDAEVKQMLANAALMRKRSVAASNVPSLGTSEVAHHTQLD